MKNDTSILLPHVGKIVTDTTSYWAAFYCSALKTLRYQKNLPYGWGKNRSLQEYKGELRISSFFTKMKDTVNNHAFEYVMVDFLKTNDGLKYFKELCGSVLNDYGINGFEISFMNIFKVGTDSEIFDARQNYEKNKLMMLLPNGIKAMPESRIEIPNGDGRRYRLGDTLKYSDLFIIISDGQETIGFVGEVEGNHGEDLYRKSYFFKNKNKNLHCVFGVSVTDKIKHAGISIKENITLNRSEDVDRWILNFSKSNDFIKDYNSSIENLKNLIEGHFGYIDHEVKDAGHIKVLKIIKDAWGENIFDLISSLEVFVDYVAPASNFHYQEETLDGKVIYRPSTLLLADQLPLYSIMGGSNDQKKDD